VSRRSLGGAFSGLLLATTLALYGCAPDTPGGESGTVASGSEEWPGSFAIGRDATPAEIAELNIDFGPDGADAPPGSGSVAEGRVVYDAKCAVCHGPTGREGPNPQLVGREPRDGFPFAETRGIVKTVGNYWPYATTVFDYVNRTMPLSAPGSLTDDEVYAVTAYVLFLNEIISENSVMNAETLPAVVMPARDRFVPDDRVGGPEVR
jgi:mono/diheme cytochrome c family protein